MYGVEGVGNLGLFGGRKECRTCCDKKEYEKQVREEASEWERCGLFSTSREWSK